MEPDRRVGDVLGRQAHARDGDRVPDREPGGGPRRLDLQRQPLVVALDADDATHLAHDPREHGTEATGLDG